MNDAQTDSSMTRRVRGMRFDVIAAVLTAIAISLALVVAILTPPKSGPFCIESCVGYPYTDIAASGSEAR
jgi:energy-converting hydrogenase Eha subunit A